MRKLAPHRGTLRGIIMPYDSEAYATRDEQIDHLEELWEEIEQNYLVTKEKLAIGLGFSDH
jgi:hypothetical protein